MNSTLKNTVAAGVCALSLVSCSNAKEQLGLNKQAPDEFAVVKRAPLEMPRDYDRLPPPRPGAGRPQERKPVDEARQTVFGDALRGETNVSGSESSLLDEAKAYEADPEIRQVIDQEAAEAAEKERPVADRLLNWASSGGTETPAAVVDPEKEVRRLKRNMDAGKSVTEGKTPSVDR